MRNPIQSILALSVLMAFTEAATNLASADDLPPTEHYVSMRSYVADAAPGFVLAVSVPNDERASALVACDGHTYYVSPTDAYDIQLALTNGDTVQLHEASGATPPAQAAISCLFGAQE